MSFLLQRRSKAAAPTPDPPVRQQVPDRGVIQASVLVVPPDGLVCKTGMEYEEFDVKSLSQMYLGHEKISGVVQVAQCNSGAIIIADIVSVPMKDVEQVRPETWYLPLRHAWKYPVICGDARLLARSKVEVDQHHTNSAMQPDKDYKGFGLRQLLEGHRVFLVVHWLIGPYSEEMRIALNIHANISYYKSDIC